MAAQNVQQIDRESVCSHIYNRGASKENIFNDDQDYQVFLGYLKEYLSPQDNSENIKKAFTANGQTSRGTPHQLNNFFGKGELIAYSLMPNHFHLVLRQKTDGFQENRWL